MASVRRKRGSQYWFACYTGPDGSRRQVSTKTADKKAAMKIAWAAEEATRRKATAEQARKILSDLVEDIHGTPVTDEAVGVYLQRWRTRRSSEVSTGSDTRFKDVFEAFRKHLAKGNEKAWETMALSDLSTAHVAGFRDAMAASGYSPVTINLSLKVLKQALKDAWLDGLIAESPAAKIKLLREDNVGTTKKVFTMEQYQDLLKAADEEWRGMIMAGVFTGQRLADIASMRMEDVKPALGGVWWRFKSRKTGAQMAIPLAKPFVDWMQKWLSRGAEESEWMFPAARATMDRTSGRVSTLSNQFHRIMATAGLVEPRNGKLNLGKGRSGGRATAEYSFHSFRHTCTTWLKAQGQPESVAMAFVGHESKAVNRSYTHLPESALLQATRALARFSVVRAA